MLVDAAKHGDVEIPVFCYEPKLGNPVGACRMCLVEIEGIPKLQTGCSTPVKDGMVVHTQTERVKTAQQSVVEFLLINHPLDCPVCDKGGECPLQDITFGWGAGISRFIEPKRHFVKPLELSPHDRDRPRALHPLLPLRALLPGDLRGLPAGAARARRALLRLDLRRPPLRRAVQRQHHRAVPRRRAHLAPLPLPRAPVGHRGRRLGLHALPGAVQRHADRPRRARAARARARERRGRRRLAVRQGALRLPGARHGDERITEPLLRDGGELRPVSWERALAGGRRRACARAGARTGAIAGGRTHQRGGPPARAPAARGPRLAAPRLAPRRRAAAGAAPRAGRPARCRRRSPTSSSPTRCSCSTPTRSTTRRSSTCACARACAATACSLVQASARGPAERRARRRAGRATARGRRGGRDPVGRAPDRRPRRRRGRAGAARARRDALAGGHRRRRPARNPRRRATGAACARRACCRTPGPGSPSSTARAGPRRARDRRGPGRGRAERALPARRADPLAPATCRATAGELWERALERATHGRRARDVPHRRPARARRRRLPGRGLRREGGHGRPPRRAPAAAAPGHRPPGRDPRAGWQVLAELAARLGSRPRRAHRLDGLPAAVRRGALLRGPDARGDRRPRRALAGARRGRRRPAGARV